MTISDLTTVADLEVCGLSVRSLEMLERMDYILITDLERLTERELLREPGSGEGIVENVREALQNYVDGRTTKTMGECLGRQT